MHRQLRAERNFSSYPWVDAFDSPAAAAGGAQADTAHNDNTRPRHSAPNRLVLFIRSPPPKWSAASLRRPTSLPIGPPFRTPQNGNLGPANVKNASPRAALKPRGDGVLSHSVGWPAESPACKRQDRHNAGTAEKAPPRATRRRAERSPATLFMPPAGFPMESGRRNVPSSMPRCLDASMPRCLDASMPSSREVEPGGIEPPCRFVRTLQIQ